ncbi:hypothetical protein KU15F69_37990 [Escherichia coli]
MADNFQLKAIITAVDRLSGPLKGMQRQLKGFQKEVSSLALGAAGAGIWGDTVVECVLNKLCPSHTYVIFKYPE